MILGKFFRNLTKGIGEKIAKFVEQSWKKLLAFLNDRGNKQGIFQSVAKIYHEFRQTIVQINREFRQYQQRKNIANVDNRLRKITSNSVKLSRGKYRQIR